MLCERNGHIPRLDLRAGDTIRGSNVIASRAFPRIDGLGATLLHLHRDADDERRSLPNIAAGHKGVVLLDFSRRERELGLDTVTVELFQSTGKLAVWGSSSDTHQVSLGCE
jgi:hypothetical protein